MKAAGVPTVPGSDGLVGTESEAKEVAAEIGYPLMVKATAGAIFLSANVAERVALG